MKPEFGEDYGFRWKDLGDIQRGRPNLGKDVSVLVYRLAQYTMREAIARRFDDATAAGVLRDAGWMAGRELCLNTLDTKRDLGGFVDQLQEVLKTQRIGILRLEKVDAENLTFTLTVSEDLDCSGLPVSGSPVCEYDEGFIAGVLYAYTGREFTATEVDCWATGDRTCRFSIKPELATA